MEKLLKEQDVKGFLSKVRETFPNFVAGIITDRNGFPIASEMPEKFHIRENELALSAIAKKRDFISEGESEYMQVKRDFGKNDSVRMMILLRKSYKYINRFKSLKKIVRNQNLF
ncbi:MAG: hypothetical protein ACOC44_10470 [Promethearchaeia archaeon]